MGSRHLVVPAILLASIAAFAGEPCTSPYVAPEPSGPGPGFVLPLSVVELVGYYQQRTFKVEVSLSRPDSGLDACVVEVGEQLEMRLSVTNVGDVTAVISHNTSKVWAVYIFHAGTFEPVVRLSEGTAYDDFPTIILLEPGEAFVQTARWFAHYSNHDPLAPGRYDLILTVEPEGSIIPDFTLPDDQHSARLTFVLVEPG